MQNKFFKIFKKGISKVEKGSFRTANFLHKMSVNVIILGTGYIIYSTLRDYNNYYLEA